MMRNGYKEKTLWDGIQRIYEFDNGYGASVVRRSMSYGGSDGLWELAVKWNGSLCYDTPITDDVLGYLNEEMVNYYLEKIEQLTKP